MEMYITLYLVTSSSTQYGIIELGRHWSRCRLGAWWLQAIAWTNGDLSQCRQKTSDISDG